MAQTVVLAQQASKIDWLVEANKIGEIQLETKGGRTKFMLSMGRWGHCQLRVWGLGATVEEAAMHAVTKARAFGTLMPPHPDDC